MTGRVVAEIAVAVVITAILIIVGFAALELSDGAAPGEAFLVSGPATAFGLVGIGFGVWVITSIAGGLLARARSRGFRLAISILAGLGGAMVNAVVWGVVGFTGGGWAMLLFALALLGSLVLVVSVVVASLVTYLVLFRRAA